MAAFRTAVKAGAEGVEFDVHLTADGVPVVFHDDELRRTTGKKGLLRDRTWAELRTFDTGRWFGPAFHGERIPTLRQTLDFLDGRVAVINVELKNKPYRYAGIEKVVQEEMARKRRQSRIVVSSFDSGCLERWGAEWPKTERAWLVERPPLLWLHRVRQLGVRGINPKARWVTRRFVERAHGAGLSVWAWTVDTPEELRRLAACGVDAVFSNDPAAATRILRD